MGPPAVPPARVLDVVRVLSAAAARVGAAAVRRSVGVRRRPEWTARFELWVAAARGAWSVMPKIGMVRWRNVTEALTLIRTAGVTPRFVRYVSPEGLTVQGAWLEPDGGRDGPVLLYFHGAGYVFGSLRSHGELIGALARAARARTFAPEYRLGPEHPAPAAAEDAIAAYRYLLDRGIHPRRIVIAGDSAGGTMVLNALISLRDAGSPPPAAAVAISPWVDLACSGDSFDTNVGFDFVGREHCLLAARDYLNGCDPRRPAISPLFAPLERLPPLLIHAGAAEVLVDQIRSFAQRAEKAGIDVRLEVYPAMVQVWHLMRGITPAADHAIEDIAAFVQEHTLDARRRTRDPQPWDLSAER